MSLLHSRPVAVQRVYYKPSAMARLKAMFTSRHHHPHHQTPAQPRTATAAPRRTGRRGVVTRQPVRKTGFFHRTPRRTVVATQRRPGFLASLRPRRHARTAPVVASGGHHHHKQRRHHHHQGHKGSTMAALLAAISLKKKHERHSHQRAAPRHYY